MIEVPNRYCDGAYNRAPRMAIFLPILSLLLWAPGLAIASSKDPTLHGANSYNHSPHTTGQAGLKSSTSATGKGKLTGSPLNTNPKADLGSQLNHVENARSQEAAAPQTRPSTIKSVSPTPKGAIQADKIDFRSRPQQQKAMNNQNGNGSGSKKYGPGRRIAESTH